MTDMHSHILPGIDDGSQSIEMSIEMLKESRAQGVETIVATPHCYLRRESDIDDFLQKREESFSALSEAIKGESLPKIIKGAEVHIEGDVSFFEGLERLCIEGTDYILIEMSYGKWKSTMYDALYSMTVKKMKPIMAHIERFFNNEKEFDNLREIDLAYQINAESFFDPAYKRAVAYLLRCGMANVVGSDMHNTEIRVQNLKQGYTAIEKEYGAECANFFAANARLIINNESPNYHGFERLGFFKRHGRG